MGLAGRAARLVAGAYALAVLMGNGSPGMDTKLGIVALGVALVGLNWLLMLRSKAIIRAVGPVPLQLFGAVFGVLQLALGMQFMVDAATMLSRGGQP